MRATCRTVGNRPTQEVPQRASTSAPGARSRNSSADIKSGIDKCLIARPTVTGGNDVVCDGQDIISSRRARRSSESVHESSSGLALTPVTRPGRSRMSSSFSVLVEADDQCWISSTQPRSRSHTASAREPFEVVTAVSWSARRQAVAVISAGIAFSHPARLGALIKDSVGAPRDARSSRRSILRITGNHRIPLSRLHNLR